MMIESNKIEFKSKYTDQIIKEIVSFLNADGGKIYIGVNDDGSVCGAQKIDEILRNISDVVTMQIEPSAIEDVKPELEFLEGLPVVVINVKKGILPIYCIKKYGFSSNGCLIRIGSSCRSMSETQINERYKLRFFDDDIIVSSPTNLESLSFFTLKNSYLEVGLRLNDDTFETNLKLINSRGKYNIMAELLSDNNRFSLIFVKFNGLNKASISQRSDYGDKSIIFGYRQLMNRIAAENICLSNTTVRPRIDTYLFDYDSVNEAIVNAIVHNDWSITEPQVSFFRDRIEILSHGGLPHNLSIEEFYRGISKPRNTRLMKIFSDLDIVDHTGHGVPIIIEKYGKEAFEINDKHIIVTIPFNKQVMESINVGANVGQNVDVNINDTERKIIEMLINDPTLTAEKISMKIEKSKRTAERYLKALQEKGIILRTGSDKKGYWKIIK
ncbi:MAG: winged helix-turn-helix transcriptional regulator [Erysipelotrichaceae bacterium]|nr:winged helix-turn-helix transcriptional regulator [Erysipelotrichaceae bacterium]